ncbi:hypothetical protein G9A89_008540 [Geosiphon pyriformis]|nr:hypothetical protein G9A89_008540 [Geosiphon pyriformis]
MELPDLGRHCSKTSCKQLDYLPFKCQYCKKEFCQEHSKAQAHDCLDAPSEEGVRVPTCPVCNVPVPINKGEDPNIRMEQHIANDCSPPPKTTSNKPFNACSFHTCKQRVAVRLLCPSCGKNYCIKHRLDVDHNCDKIKAQNKVSNVTKLGGKMAINGSGWNNLKPKITIISH